MPHGNTVLTIQNTEPRLPHPRSMRLPTLPPHSQQYQPIYFTVRRPKIQNSFPEWVEVGTLKTLLNYLIISLSFLKVSQNQSN